jgi:hypothetical protein
MQSVGSCVVVLLVWRIVSLARRMGFYSESTTDILVVVRGRSRGSPPWSMVWSCVAQPRPLSQICVTVETPMLRTLRLALTSPIHQWGFAWDGMWQRTVWRPSRTFWCRTRGSSMVWWWPASCLADVGPYHWVGPSLTPVRLAQDLIAWPSSRGCSARTWSPTPPHEVAWQGLGHLLRLAGLLGKTWSPAPPREVS